MSPQRKLIFVCLLIGLCGVLAQRLAHAAPRACGNGVTAMEGTRFCSGVRNSPDARRLTPEQLELIAQRLREITGWQALAFDADGFLICPDPPAFSGGSAAARKLLNAAMFGKEAYDLESHYRSQKVKFGRIGNGTDYTGYKHNHKISARPIQIDFADFRQLRGEPTVLKAFDPGFIVLHELAHGVWGLRDAFSEAEEPGECENYINQIRRELHLPERQQYEAHARSHTNRSRWVAELHFILFREEYGQLRRKRFFLQWDAEMVGALDTTHVAALVR